MAQITLYLDEETELKLKNAAEGEGVSASSWVRDLILEKTSSEWPISLLNLEGAWKELPDLSEIRASEGDDVPRESL